MSDSAKYQDPEFMAKFKQSVKDGWSKRSRVRTPEAIESLQAGADRRSQRQTELRRSIIQNVEIDGIPEGWCIGRQGVLLNQWSVMVIERDAFTCLHCGVTPDDRYQITSHHVIPFQGDGSASDFSLSNGQTLCRSCHLKVHKSTISRWHRE